MANLSARPDALQTAFGRYLFTRFAAVYPQFFAGVSCSFDFFELVETYIHVEVRKLYPDAELPSFDIQRQGAERITMVYRSARRMDEAGPFAMNSAEKARLPLISSSRMPSA